METVNIRRSQVACFCTVLPVWWGVESVNVEDLIGSNILKVKLKNTSVPKAFCCENWPRYL